MLGCFNAPNSEITLIQGWNWYAGADPSQIGANQYDFETTVLHELGHALGLGGSTDPTSPMYETLASGVADRTVTTQDLNIPDPPEGADPQMAAGPRFALPPSVVTSSDSAASAGSAANLSHGGLMPLLPGAFAGLSVATMVMPQPSLTQQPGWTLAPAINVSPTAAESSLVTQRIATDIEPALIPRDSSESTNPSPSLDETLRHAERVAQPTIELRNDADDPSIPDDRERIDHPAVVPATLRTELDMDAIFDSLAADVISAGTACQPVIEALTDNTPVLLPEINPTQKTSTSKTVVADLDSSRGSADFTGRLAAILLAAGIYRYTASAKTRTDQRVGTFRPGTRILKFMRRTDR